MVLKLRIRGEGVRSEGKGEGRALNTKAHCQSLLGTRAAKANVVVVVRRTPLGKVGLQFGHAR
jgi:hypothetical protein